MISYTVGAENPNAHLLDVEMLVEREGDQPLEVSLPVWTPGSYLVRDHAKNVRNFHAQSLRGRALPFRKIAKETWRVEGRGDVEISYQVYSQELSVHSTHVDRTHIHLNPPSSLLYVRGRLDEPHRVTLNPPRGWWVETAARKAGSNSYIFRNYDELVDTPFEVGTPRGRSFSVRGVPHRLVVWGRGDIDLEALTLDLERIAREEWGIFGEFPYTRYLFFLLLGPSKKRGGLEHRSSTTLLYDPTGFRPEKRYREFLSLAAHELFHSWNVKTIRPEVFRRLDYSKENYTTLLWAMEGLTSYYDTLVLVRAGILTEEKYREYLSERIGKFREAPGRFLDTLESASFDAWVRFYRADESFVNSGISYYLKGELLGLLLDLEIRRKSKGKNSLDSVMRALYKEAKCGEAIEEREGWIRRAERFLGIPLRRVYTMWIRSPGDLPLERYLRFVGWELKRKEEGRGWIGATFKEGSSPPRVHEVYSGSPAEKGGLETGDEILALDGFRTPTVGALEEEVAARKPGERVVLTLFRRDEIQRLEIVVGRSPPTKFTLEPKKGVSPSALRLRREWLSSSIRR